MPGGTDIKPFAEAGNFHCGGDTADLGDMDADEVKKSLGHRAYPFVGAVEKFAHGDGYAGFLAKEFEVADIFRRKRIFNKKRAVLFERSEQIDGIRGGESFVHVVEEFDLFAADFANGFKDFPDGLHVHVGVHVVVFAASEARVLEIGCFGDAGGAVSPHLDTHMAVSGSDKLLDIFDHIADVVSAGMGVAVHSEAAFATEELIDRHASAFAFDVPERLVEAAEGIIEHGAVAPVGTDVSSLPDILDIVGIFAYAKVVEVFVDRSHNAVSALAEGRAADAIEAGFGGFDFDDNQFDSTLRGSGNGFDMGDFDRFETEGSLVVLVRSGSRHRRKSQSTGSTEAEGFEHVAAGEVRMIGHGSEKLKVKSS